MDLFGEIEKLKLKFISAAEALHEQGKLSEDDLQQILDVLDHFEELPPATIKERLNPLLSLSRNSVPRE